MKAFRARSALLAMAVACLAWAGCGGGEVSDPDSDRSAASAEPPKAADPGDAPVAGATGPAPVAPSSLGPVALADTSPPTPADADKSAPKGDSSGTDELMKLGTNPPSPSPSGDAPAPGLDKPTPPSAPASPGASPAAPGGGSNPPGSASMEIPSAPSERGRDREAPGAVPSAPGGAPSAPGAAPSAPGAAPMAPASPGGGSASGTGIRPISGEPSAPGAPRGSGVGLAAGSGSESRSGSESSSNPGAKAFDQPSTAVKAFLEALKAKDKDRLSQATAKRAPTEAAEKHRKIFAAIIDQSISDDELDEMSKAMDGFQFMQQVPARSTGRIDIVVAKRSGKDLLERTIVTRKEKEGWKVLDIERVLEFKPLPLPTRGTSRGRRR